MALKCVVIFVGLAVRARDKKPMKILDVGLHARNYSWHHTNVATMNA